VIAALLFLQARRENQLAHAEIAGEDRADKPVMLEYRVHRA
jgi:hypothetical protein